MDGPINKEALKKALLTSLFLGSASFSIFILLLSIPGYAAELFLDGFFLKICCCLTPIVMAIPFFPIIKDWLKDRHI